MSTVTKIQTTVKRLQQAYITAGKARRFAHGVAVVSMEAFASLNAAGRSLSANRWTGENRMRRAITDAKLGDQLQQLLVSQNLGGKQGYWYCSLDHSQFGPFCVAVLAISHRKGRAIPIWCQVNKSEAALIAPLLVALEALLQELARQAPELKLVFVMDRWFASDKLFKLFTEHHAYFIARTKSDKQIVLPWDPTWWKTPIQEISQLETAITYRTHQLRLVCSELRPGMKDPEP